MRMMKWAAVAAIVLAACDRGAGGAGGAGAAAKNPAQARADSVQDEQKALRDSGVSVDTQTIDTGNAAPATPAVDN